MLEFHEFFTWRETRMIDKIELHHLRTLNALYKFRSISAAAEYLSVSQQATSLQLKKIRAILGDRLFVRTGHGVVPTPYAKLIEPHIYKVLNHLNTIPLPDSTAPDHVERTLVISATDYTQKIIVGGLIKELRKAPPGLPGVDCGPCPRCNPPGYGHTRPRSGAC